MSSSLDAELSAALREVLEEYPVDLIGDGISEHPVREVLNSRLPRLLEDIIPDSEQFEIHGSPGRGRWTSIPWVAVRDPRVSESIQEGVYVVYLFEPQKDRVFLTLNQGVKKLKDSKGTIEARAALRDRAEEIRREYDAKGFTPEELEFEYASPRNELYGPGTIFYNEYSKDELDTDIQHSTTIQDLLTTYQRVVGSRNQLKDDSTKDGVPSSEREYRVCWLRDRYREVREWSAQQQAATQTSAAVRQLTEALVVASDTIDTAGLTALFRLCQHSDQIRVETKQRAVRELDIPAEAMDNILSYIDESIGTVGGPNFFQQIPNQETGRRIHDLLKVLVSTNDSQDLDAAVAAFAEEDIPGLQSGSLSPILHYLQPTLFPIVNDQSISGMAKCFGGTLDGSFESYLDSAEQFRRVRDRYGFEDHFRDLDYFFVWVNQKTGEFNHDWTWMLTDGGTTKRDVYAIQPGTSGSEGGKDIRPYLWPVWRDEGIITVGGEDEDLRRLSPDQRSKLGNQHSWGATNAWETLMEMSPGDIVIAKYGNKSFRGVGVVKPDSYEYDVDGPGYQSTDDGSTTKHPHLRAVDWIMTSDEGWTVSEVGLETRFSRPTAYEYVYFEEFRYKYASVLDDGVNRFAALEASSREFSGERESRFIHGGATSGASPRSMISRQQTPPIETDPADLFGDLYYPDADQLANQILAALRSGKHIVFTGPPGTGKTELAENVSEVLLELDDSPFTDYRLTTATADWTTFDTVGGRVPDGNTNRLVFSPGIVLERFKRGGEQRNDLLIIDELNRADIDKAFGQLFTVLSGQRVELPFERTGRPVEVLPANQYQGSDPESHEYVVPNTWRLFATMNSYDKTTLYEMSYAFMRRLTFINVPIPDLQVEDVDGAPIEFMAPYLASWFDTDSASIDRETLESDEALPDPEDVEAALNVWRTLAHGEFSRPIGPAIVKDMLSYMNHHDGTREERLIDAVSAYVLAQLEGVPERKELVVQLCELDAVGGSADQLQDSAAIMLDVSFNEGSGDSLVRPS